MSTKLTRFKQPKDGWTGDNVMVRFVGHDSYTAQDVKAYTADKRVLVVVRSTGWGRNKDVDYAIVVRVDDKVKLSYSADSFFTEDAYREVPGLRTSGLSYTIEQAGKFADEIEGQDDPFVVRLPGRIEPFVTALAPLLPGLKARSYSGNIAGMFNSRYDDPAEHREAVVKATGLLKKAGIKQDDARTLTAILDGKVEYVGERTPATMVRVLVRPAGAAPGLRTLVERDVEPVLAVSGTTLPNGDEVVHEGTLLDYIAKREQGKAGYLLHDTSQRRERLVRELGGLQKRAADMLEAVKSGQQYFGGGISEGLGLGREIEEINVLANQYRNGLADLANLLPQEAVQRIANGESYWKVERAYLHGEVEYLDDDE